MKEIFPPDIINLTVENHFYRFSKFSCTIYSLTILFIAGVVICLFFIKTNISVQSVGIIRSSSESIKITCPVVSEVLKTNIDENKFVQKGDTLIWLNYEKPTERINHLKALVLQNEEYQNDLRQMLAFRYNSIKTSLYKSVHAQYRQKLAEYDLEISLLRKSFARAKSLFEKEVIPQTEIEEKQFQLDKIIESKKIFVKQNRSEWQQLDEEYRLKDVDYKNAINELLKDFDNYVIISPGTGYVTNFNGIQAGSYVTTGQTIAVISPNDKLISEYLVPPRDIGYLRNKMPVIFQIDAYNYNQWGLASGEIIDISNEIYLINNQPYFKVRCSLNEQYLTLKNGFKGILKKGLTTTARFQVTERTLAQLLFDKADDWLNPKLNK